MTRILIVDDKEENLYYLRTVLAGHGYAVDSACHGAQALVKARLAPPDLVVSDLLMPVMDGYTLLRHWKIDDRLRKIPFIVYTATYTEEEDEQLALRLGADAFILKPAEPEDFLARVREVQGNAAASVPTPPKYPVGDENALLKVYSETLIRKLEEKTLQLEEANRALQQDVAARIVVEVRLQRQNRLYAVSSAISDAIVRLKETSQLYEQACRIAVEQGGLVMAWVGLVQAECQILKAVARWGRDEGYLDSIQVRTNADHHEGRGPAGQAFRTRAPACCNDIDADVELFTSRVEALQRGYHSCAAFPITLEGRPVGVLAVYSNQAGYFGSEELHVLNSLAENLSFATERQALEQQFLRAQRMESVGTLAGGIAHDLNNVLGPIIMALDLLRLKFTDPDSQDLISMITSSAQRGSAMVSQVLSFARGVEGKRVELQLKHVIRDMEKIANDTFLKNIQVRTVIPDDLWTILGDPTQLHQVLLNLCVNARDAMPNGGTLTISAENLNIDAHYAGLAPEARPGSYVLLQVEDTGRGMPPETIEKIFDPFFTTKEVGKGTGLGLSTTLGIVKSHHGFIQVYSEPGKGTIFKVCFPGQPGGSVHSAPQIAAELPRGNGELILVIDDEATIREITRQTLESFGYRVVLASDGAEATAAFASHSAEIAAVLTDVMMPVMDGAATIPVLQRMNSQMPIIAASGLASEAQIERFASLGVKHFLPKPFTAAALLKILRQVLAEER